MSKDRVLLVLVTLLSTVTIAKAPRPAPSIGEAWLDSKPSVFDDSVPSKHQRRPGKPDLDV